MVAHADWTDDELLAFKAKAINFKGKSAALSSIVNALARQLGDDEWIAAFRGTRPEILPLTPRQMEAVQGGMLPVSDPADGAPWIDDLLRVIG